MERKNVENSKKLLTGIGLLMEGLILTGGTGTTPQLPDSSCPTPKVLLVLQLDSMFREASLHDHVYWDATHGFSIPCSSVLQNAK